MVNDLERNAKIACVSDLTLDRLRAAELGKEDAREVAAHLRDCDRCRARQQRFEQRAESYLASPASQATLRAVVSQRAAPRRLKRALLTGCSALAAAAALLMFMARPSLETVRHKGGGQLGFFVKRGERVFRGSDGEHVQPGDQLRFTAHPSHPVHLSIFGIDEAGAVSLYYPLLGAPQALEPRREEQALSAAVELDDVLGQERILALFCSEPQPLDELRRALASQPQSSAPAGCSLETLHLYKERAPP